MAVSSNGSLNVIYFLIGCIRYFDWELFLAMPLIRLCAFAEDVADFYVRNVPCRRGSLKE